MATITNGSVSRTFKPADYEGRTIALSFTVDVGEDYDAVLATVTWLAEKHARAVPTARDKPVQAKHPPKPIQEVIASLPEAEQTAIAERAEELIADELLVAELDPPHVTDDALMKACQRTTSRFRDPERTKSVIATFVEKPGMSVRSIVQEKRAAFIEALDALKPGE